MFARIRIGVTPWPTAEGEREEHEPGREPAAGDFQFRIGPNIFVG
jgi:hypothetical protein